MDRAWWKVHHVEAQSFKGRKITHFRNEYGAERIRFQHGGNSGGGAISLAAHLGARRIVLLGYDCKHGKDGKRHWHGDHPKGLGNANVIDKWPRHFRDLSLRLKGIEIVNSTRDTALDVFPLMSLEDALS